MFSGLMRNQALADQAQPIPWGASSLQFWACALVLLVVPPNYVAILCGLYLMRPPQFRDAEDGLATTLWSRLPDNSDAF